MGGFIRIFATLFRILTTPFRLLLRLLFKPSASRVVATARKAVGNAAATETNPAADKPQDSVTVTATFPFRAIERPKLSEQSATELSVETAQSFVDRAHRFYGHEFNLFPQGSLFYEEVEAKELAHALAADDPNSTDARFVSWMAEFRQTINDNARRMLMIYAPMLFAIMGSIAIAISMLWPSLTGVPGFGTQTIPSAFVAMPALTGLSLLILLLIYQWPFKVIIQRNLLGMDNYITSRFSRINQNFQVAKRFALNVERNKRMNDAEELKSEAGVWTVAYNWFAMRLFLCERVVRNQMYQVHRNATLYAIGGIIMSLVIATALAVGWMQLTPLSAVSGPALAVFGTCALAYVFIAYGMIVGGTAGEAARVLRGNEWFRFGAAELNRTIAEHVGEDKLQIITFRDRNRME